MLILSLGFAIADIRCCAAFSGKLCDGQNGSSLSITIPSWHLEWRRRSLRLVSVAFSGPTIS